MDDRLAKTKGGTMFPVLSNPNGYRRIFIGSDGCSVLFFCGDAKSFDLFMVAARLLAQRCQAAMFGAAPPPSSRG
ncbi:hypothetical protein ACYJW8_11000 [Frateuria aurantia]